MNRGDWLPGEPGSPNGRDADPAAIERAYREGLRDLGRLEGAVDGDQEITRDIRELQREMQRLDPKRFPGNPELVERLRSQVVSGLEQLELQLRRKLEDRQGGNVRSTSPEAAPPGYAGAVAEYFRKLSKGN